MEAGKTSAPGQVWLHKEFEASLHCYMRHCVKQIIISEGELGFSSGLVLYCCVLLSVTIHCYSVAVTGRPDGVRYVPV